MKGNKKKRKEEECKCQLELTACAIAAVRVRTALVAACTTIVDVGLWVAFAARLRIAIVPTSRAH
jgi:hypothetical protein